MSTEQLAQIDDVVIDAPAAGDLVVDTQDNPAVDPVIEKAVKAGWTDKDAWIEAGKDPEEWVDAAEFERRKPLFNRLHKLERAMKDKDAKLEAVSRHAAQVAELTRKRVLEELEAKRTAAVEVGDVDAFKEADSELRKVEQEKPVVVADEIPEEVRDFAERNSKWFEKDEDMTDYALIRAQKYGAQGKSRAEFLPLVEADVRRAFAHKFTNPNKEKPAAVSASSGERRPKGHTYADLNDGQKAVWASLKNSGMKLETYIQELKDLGELK
jgi:hypothetical protein